MHVWTLKPVDLSKHRPMYVFGGNSYRYVLYLNSHLVPEFVHCEIKKLINLIFCSPCIVLIYLLKRQPKNALISAVVGCLFNRCIRNEYFLVFSEHLFCVV